ncbi:MAG TPA: MFS transporter [Streptosporangiaceae bacterium]|nr:MFS transporter [Streptosporangiaceae bacterium]
MTLLTIAATPFIANADAGIVALALPDIQRDLGMTMTSAQWVTNIYVLLVGGFQLVGGRLSDIVGRRRLFLSCLAGFTATSAACGLAPGGGLLIAARAGQAITAALLIPAAMAITITMFPDGTQRSKAIAMWGMIGGTGAIAGTCAGGVLVTQLDWRWAFFINVPIGALVFMRARRLIPYDPVRRVRAAGDLATAAACGANASDEDVPRADVPGAVMMTSGLLFLIHGLVRTADHGWNDRLTVGSFAAGVVLLVAFAFHQSRARHPLMPPAVLRSRGIVCGGLGVLLVSAATAPVIFVGSLYLQQVHQFTSHATGFMLVPVVGGVLLAGPLAGRLLGRLGPLTPYLIGCGTILAGLLVLTRITPESGYVDDILPGLALTGLGLPLVWITSEVVSTTAADERTAGMAAGVVQSAGQIGAAIGLALAITTATAHADTKMAAGTEALAALSDGIGHAFLVAAILIVLAVLNAVIGLRPRRRTRGRQLQKRTTRL